jgi:hypothetical protein
LNGFGRSLLVRAALLFAATCGCVALPGLSAAAGSFAGTYAIEGAADLQQRGLYHFLYVHPSGKFYMAAEWAGNETSRAAGH